MDTTRCRSVSSGRISSRSVGHVLRLDGQDEHVAAGDDLAIVADGGGPVSLVKLARVASMGSPASTQSGVLSLA